MLKLSELKHLGNALKANAPDIEKVHYCVNEDHVMAKLKDRPGIHMVILYPQTDTTGKQEEEIDQNAIWIWLVEKDVTGQSDEDEFAQFEKLQLMMQAIKKFIADNFHSCNFKYLNRYQPSSTQIIPEFNEFGGFNGWSMSLVF